MTLFSPQEIMGSQPSRGSDDGAAVGLSVEGLLVGFSVGANVDGWTPVGHRDGSSVGSDVVGPADGKFVGDTLGGAMHGPQYPGDRTQRRYSLG